MLRFIAICAAIGFMLGICIKAADSISIRRSRISMQRKQRLAELMQLERELAQESARRAKLEEQITHYEMQLTQVRDLWVLVNAQYERETDAKKRTTLFNKLITLDQRAFTIQQRIYKLKEDE